MKSWGFTYSTIAFTWVKGNKFPIVKGGNFTSPPMTVDANIADHDPNKGEEWIGFRTISRNPPPDAE